MRPDHAPRVAPPSRSLHRRDRGMAPKELLVAVAAFVVPVVVLMALYSNLRGAHGRLLGTDSNRADQQIPAQRGAQSLGSRTEKSASVLDLSAVATGNWAGRAGQGAEVQAKAGASSAPASRATRSAPAEPTAPAETLKRAFEVQAGSTLASGKPVASATLHTSAARSQSCSGAQGPCECPAPGTKSRGAGAAGATSALPEGGVVALLGVGPIPEARAPAEGCRCGPGVAPRPDRNPAYLALGLDDPFFKDALPPEPEKPPRGKLREAAARAPAGMWRRLEPTAKGIKRWELLRAGDYVLARQASRIATAYDGSALPPKGLWVTSYRPRTALEVVNREPGRTAAFVAAPESEKRLEKALRSADSRAWDVNKRALYEERKVEVGAKVSLSSRERYAVVNQALDEEIAKEFGVAWGVEEGKHRPALGSTAIVTDPRTGTSHVAVVADQVPKDSGGEVSAGLREAFAESIGIGGALEDRDDAVETLYVVHDPTRGGSPVLDTRHVAGMEAIADRQALDILPTLIDQIAAWERARARTPE